MIPLTIITASFDQGRYIRRTIESVLAQGVAGLEYLVYDGGSTDDTLTVLAEYDGRLRWVSERDRGQAHAINKGLVAARGEIVGWLNSDDTYAPRALADVLAFFAANPEVDVVYGDARYIGEHDEDLGPYPVRSVELLRAECFLAQPAVLLRRRLVERVGLLDEGLDYAMDYDYWLRLVAAGARFAYLPRVLAHCRVHDRAKTVIGGLRQAREVYEVQRRHTGSISSEAIRHYVRALFEDRGLSPGTHPIAHRLLAAPIACYLVLRHSPRELWPFLRWQLDWPKRLLGKRGFTWPPR